MTEFHLTEAEKHHPTVVRLLAHLQGRLDAMRMRNDNEQMTPIETASLRGQIRCLKSIIGLGDDRPMTGEQEAPQGASTMRRP